MYSILSLVISIFICKHAVALCTNKVFIFSSQINLIIRVNYSGNRWNMFIYLVACTRVIWKVSDLTKIRHFLRKFVYLSTESPCNSTYFSQRCSLFVTRPNSTRRFSLQNNCFRRWLPLHLTKISVLRAQFLDERTKWSRLGVDLVSKADGRAVQSVIREFSPWQQLRC